jgi:ABC-2 type transport system ATP-binding protein
MHTVEISHVAKSFGDVHAVEDVSFDVEQGEIFGLLGPNGAGKTTTIRLMLDIFKPERGTISIFDGPMDESKKERIGYMPEERGLYQDVQLERCLLYLSSLKGMPVHEAKEELDGYLEQFDLAEHRHKKVISTILHRPELVIIDEPFSALDPINTQLVKDLIRNLRAKGVTIVMSTHQMHQVEELCDRIVLIDDGLNVLYGPLNDIRRQFSGHAILVRTAGEIPQIDGVLAVASHNNASRLTLSESTSPQEVLERFVEHNIQLEKFEIAVPTLDEIFIKVVAERDQ